MKDESGAASILVVDDTPANIGFLLETLSKAGYRVQVLIAYGEAWYPWYMRRLAERPANVTFAIRSLLP